MKRTITANISGIVFNIDEDAYEKLHRYFQNVKHHLANEVGSEEVIADIENRVAEIFREKQKDQRQTITLPDVEEVISQLGDPGQIGGEESAKDAGEKKKYTYEPETENIPKRLYRNPDDRYIGGVCSGIATYIQTDPTWIRLAFVVFFLMGFGLILYIIMWIVVPMARTTAEKLEMRGKKVNISNIKQSVREEFESVKTNLNNLGKEARDNFR